MTYEAQETSAYDGYAIEIYDFSGTTGDYRLTSFAEDRTVGVNTYIAVPGLRRKQIKKTSSGGSQTGELEVEIPFDHPLARDYAFADVPPDLTMVLRRGHLSDPDEAFITLWRGAVASWVVEERLAKLRVPSAFTLALQNSIPSKRWQGVCNHLLYDARCGANRSLHDFSSTIQSISGTSVTVGSTPWVSDEGNGGEIINNRTGERRSIQSHTGNTLVLRLPFTTAEIGDPITAFEGCDHLATTCDTKFNNRDNFGGFNLVPNLNPFTQSQLR